MLARLVAGLNAIRKHANHEKQRRLRLKVEELEWEQQRKLKKYNEACEKLEKEMLNELEKQSSDLRKSKELKAYIDEVTSLAKKEYLDGNYPIELRNWINWAKSYVEELNPLSEGLPTYEKAMEIMKLEDIE